MCGCAESTEITFVRNFYPKLTTKLESLFQYYLKVALYAKNENLFAERTGRLQAAVAAYLASQKDFDRQNLDLCAVDSVYKLHPHKYQDGTASQQWLTVACLRQHKSLQQFPYGLLSFSKALRHYTEFLFMCRQYPCDVVVPDLLADFMWHAHMQHPRKYRANMLSEVGRFLDHHDAYTPEQLQRHVRRTQQIREELMKPVRTQAARKPISTRDVGGGGGGGVGSGAGCGTGCGGGC